ncbi:MAG TPA: ABC transporter permease [Armatimonadota bacterium]
MTFRQLVLHNLRHYRRTGLIVAIGIALATAVLIGSLLVGDSVTGSLRSQALARLGTVDSALMAQHFFRAQLAKALDKDTVALTLLRGPARNPATEAVQPDVTIYGTDAAFWGLFPETSAPSLQGRQAAINAALASDLGIRAGDSLFIKVPRGMSSTDSLFAQRSLDRTAILLRLTVAVVLPNRGAGAFALTSTLTTPRNLFLSRDWLMEQMGEPGHANVLLARQQASMLNKALARACTPEDYGLKIVRNPALGTVAVQSAEMLLSDVQVHAVYGAMGDCNIHGELASVYLAKTITRPGAAPQSISYAMLAAGNPPVPFTFREGGGKWLDLNDIWLNTWAAADLHAHVGDTLSIEYLIPRADGTFGSDTVKLTVRGIVNLTGSALDRQIVPAITGVTEASRIDEWSAPFPVDLRLITQRDEEYWNTYRATPKAFVHPTTLSAMWERGAGMGVGKWITTLRGKQPAGKDFATVQTELSRAVLERMTPEQAGLQFRPVRQLALASAQGNTDFGQMFLAMGLFLVLAAASLAGTFMRLHVERRAAEIGILRAAGFRPRFISRLLLAEAGAWVLLGALVGVPLGIGYGWLIMHGLATWWRGAVGATPLSLYLTGGSISYGLLAGVLVGVLATMRGTTALSREKVLSLLAGWRAAGVLSASRSPMRTWVITMVLAALAAVLMLLSAFRGVPSPPVAFFLGGSALLVAGLLGASLALRAALRVRGTSRALGWLAVRNAAANRLRSLLVIGLAAGAAFVLVATAANRRDPSRLDVTRKDSGAGGFSLLATSSLPIHYGFGSAAGRAALGFTPRDEDTLAPISVFPFRRSPGEDVSCLNLAHPTSPRVLSVPKEFIERGGFTVLTKLKLDRESPWSLLNIPSDMENAVPVFGDADSVRWTLHADLGEIYMLPLPSRPPLKVRFVGLLPGSVFAGELLMGENNFNRYFPGAGGPTVFLIDTPRGTEKAVAATLRKGLGEMGLTVRDTHEVLTSYAAVQNTYIATFLALGGLGLLLGAFGLIIIQLRNAFERRKELALLQAVGFRVEELSTLLALENAGLLLIGLALGSIAALIAVAPQLVASDTRVSWGAVLGLLAVIALIGAASSVLSARASTRGDLLGALREE